MFKIGQKWEIINAIRVGDNHYKDGDVFTVSDIDLDGDAYDADGICILESDVGAGFIQLLNNEQFDANSLMRETIKEIHERTGFRVVEVETRWNTTLSGSHNLAVCTVRGED